MIEIAFPSDLSPESDRAFAHARFVSHWLHGRLSLYHVVETPSPQPDGQWDRAAEVHRRAADAAREHLQKLSAGVNVETRVVVEGAPSAREALLKWIETASIDLAVMSTHGREGLAHLLLGSVAEEVVQHGRCSVLAVRHPIHGARLPYQRVLIPTDLSQAATRSFPLAQRMARKFQSQVVALHVTDRETDSAQVKQALSEHFPGLKIEARVERGTPWKTIVEVAAREQIDLIAMSTLGHDSLTDSLLGSTTERVVRQAPCPVLVNRREISSPD